MRRTAASASPQPSPSSPRFISWIVWLLAVAWLVGVAVATADLFVDDAYISLRYVSNILVGNGMVFNPGQRVEGVTNLGWILALVPLATMLAPTTAAKTLGIAGVGLTLLLLLRVGHRLVDADNAQDNVTPGFNLAIALVPLLTVATVDYTYFAVAGMETGLASLLLILAAWLTVQRPGALVIQAVMGWLLFTVHPEFGLVFPGFVALMIATRVASWRAFRPAAGVWTLLIGLTTVGRWLYFGTPLPNTFYAKSVTLTDIANHVARFVNGDHHNVAPPFGSIFAVALVVFGVVTIWRRHPQLACVLASGVFASTLFSIYAAPDWTFLARFFAPATPIAMLLLSAGIARFVHQFGRHRLRCVHQIRIVGAILGVLIFAALMRTTTELATTTLWNRPGYILAGEQLVPHADWMAHNLPADAVIASRRIGALAYITQRETFDYVFGLTEPEVSRRIRQAGHVFEDPRVAALADLWTARRPDFLLEDDDVIDAMIRPGESRAGFEIHGLRYAVMRTFPLGDERSWVLCRRID